MPCVAANAPSGTATVAADPAITPGRMPPTRLAPPSATELHRPASGSTPTIALHATAFESNEKATLMPESVSAARVGCGGGSSDAAAMRNCSAGRGATSAFALHASGC